MWRHPGVAAEEEPENLEDPDAVLACGAEVGADRGKVPGVVVGLEAAGHLLVQLGHSSS
ncbi:MAG: hypothetical protein ACYCTE_12925 [Acidimicrobiales bacterium]